MLAKWPDSRRLRQASAVLAGAGGVLCFAPFGLWWLAPLPLLVFFQLARSTVTARQAASQGWLFGCGFFLAGVSWVYVSLSTFGAMPFWLSVPAVLLLAACLALYPALLAYVFRRTLPSSWVGQMVSFAVLLATVDWLRSWFLTGFPWLLFGYSQSAPSPLAAYAPLLGVHGVGLLLALIAAALSRWRVGVPLCLVLCAGGVMLRGVAWTVPDGAPVSVALIQGNVPLEMKFDPTAFVRNLLHYQDLIERHPAQLAILPETAIPTFFEQVPEEIVDRYRQLAARQQGSVLLGAVTGDGERYWNSALSVDARPVQVYRKAHLVPFGEVIPTGFAWFMNYAQIPMTSFARGAAVQPAMDFAGLKVAVDICYEDGFGEEIRHAAAQAGVLVNLSNTAWFGDSLAQPQHLQISQMRALETGRMMLRATNTGMTAAIAPNGEVQAVLPAFTVGALTVPVQAYAGETPYVRFGNLPALLLALGLLLAARLFRWRLA